MKPQAHIYIHVPFCVRKCLYCNFFSLPCSEPLAHRFLEALGAELRGRLTPGARPRTIYIGGGTPSALSAAVLTALLELITSLVDTSELGEFTVEANPGTLADEKIDALKDSGVNRISLGVQSFDDAKLRALGRVHSAAQAQEAARRLSDAGFGNLGIDLIYGVPGDTEAAWLEDLNQAAALRPKHISTYCLSLEPGTALAEKVRRRVVSPPDENLQRRLYYQALNFLSGQGYEHYELSNFALPGFRSRHNLAMWRYEPYLGFGPAAASFDGTARRRNPADLEQYCAHPGQPAETEKLSESQRAAEVMMLALRTRDGISPADFHARCGLDLRETFGGTIAELERRNLLEEVQGTSALRLTREALFVSDEVLAEFF